MGIRGAWSLLSNDPRRFGGPWLLNSEEKRGGGGISVFVDGPSLLYHVAVSGVYDSGPPLTKAQVQQKSSVPQASPAIIHVRVKNFINALLDVCQGEVHVVMDGLAPDAKITTQIGRLRIMAQQGEKNARNPKSTCNLLHLLAEASMIETLEDLVETQPRLFLHQPPRGEAETFIDCWIRKHSLSPDNVFILSDDTDFLVYSSCPGFIPFKTLEFHELDARLSLAGFYYQRAKFVPAFFADTSDDHVMTAVAALAGCDYGMSECLDRTRTKMIRTDIGGLRPRLRNDPTSAAALTAVLRYVAHWTKRRESSWLDSMIEAICCHDDEREKLLNALQEIHEIYFPNEETPSVGAAMSVESRRLLECGIMYCRPLVETWDASNEVKRDYSSRKRPRKSGKKRRKKRPTVQQDSCEMNVDDNSPRETATVPFPPTQAFVDQCLATGSTWFAFAQVRARLYSVVCQYAQAQQDRGVEFHPTWTASDPLVAEWVRVGKGEHVDFVSQPIVILRSGPLNVTSSTTVMDAVLQCTVAEDQAEGLKQNMKQDWQIMIASLMLPPRTALLLLLLCEAPRLPSEVASCTIQGELSDSLDESLLLMSVALFHARLLRNVLSVLLRLEGSAEDMVSPRGKMCLSHIFRHDVAAWIWTQMMFADSSDDAEEYEGTAANLLDACFDQMKISRKKDRPSFNQEELQTWHADTGELWRIWCLISNKATHDELK